MVVAVVGSAADGVEWVARMKHVDLAPLGVVVCLAVLVEPNEVRKHCADKVEPAHVVEPHQVACQSTERTSIPVSGAWPTNQRLHVVDALLHNT